MEAREPVRLALVEDDPNIRETLTTLFSLESSIRLLGVFEDAERAINALPGLSPQVVLMDIGLPGQDGIACVGELSRRMPGTQFMMYTVHDADERVFEALKAGANGYLLKNSSAEQIVKAVHELMNGGAPMSTLVARRVIGHYRSSAPPAGGQQEQLSERENEVLELLAQGLIYKEIADRLAISVNTVGQHVHRIYQKLHVRTRAEAVNRYFGR